MDCSTNVCPLATQAFLKQPGSSDPSSNYTTYRTATSWQAHFLRTYDSVVSLEATEGARASNPHHRSFLIRDNT